MKPITIQFDHSTSDPLYLQLYDYLKNAALTGDLEPGEKLPSLRSLAKELDISITTVQSAYNQLLVEGYITNRPQSGYYASARIPWSGENEADAGDGSGNPEALPHIGEAGLPSRSPAGARPAASGPQAAASSEAAGPQKRRPRYRYDLQSFDFVKWKKCMSWVLTDHPERLLSEGDRQGEPELREEIARYVYLSRGVRCTPEQIVVSAGTQSLTNHLSRILKQMGIRLLATEDPGYLPAQNIFRDLGFTIARIPVAKDGIVIERLPENVPAAVYVMPSNQFPTGSVMPAARRFELLDWAAANHSIIIEDDYDSELRYFGRPVPALQGLRPGSDVVYLGSFSSTLFAGIRLSYMILPEGMSRIFREQIMPRYDQTSSKTEQLTLAEYMRRGWYRSGIRKLRKLYARKLHRVLQTVEDAGGAFVQAVNRESGINVTLRVRSRLSPRALADAAEDLRLQVVPQAEMMEKDSPNLVFYYNQIPLDEIQGAVREMIGAWRKLDADAGSTAGPALKNPDHPVCGPPSSGSDPSSISEE